MKTKINKTGIVYLTRVVNTLAVNRAVFKDPRLTDAAARVRDFEGRSLVAQMLDVNLTSLGLALDDLNAQLAARSVSHSTTLTDQQRAEYVARRYAYWAT